MYERVRTPFTHCPASLFQGCTCSSCVAMHLPKQQRGGQVVKLIRWRYRLAYSHRSDTCRGGPHQAISGIEFDNSDPQDRAEQIEADVVTCPK